MKKAIVLGGSSVHIPLIEQIKKLNYYVILIDYLDNPPAKEYANEHLQKNAFSYLDVINVAKERRVDLVISACHEIPNYIACKVSEELDLPRPYNGDVALTLVDKKKMWEVLDRSSVFGDQRQFIKKKDDINWSKIVYPCVVKPVDSGGSSGVHRANNKSEVLKYLEDAFKWSKKKEIIIEKYHAGEEIMIDCFACNSEAKVLMIRGRKHANLGNDVVLQSIGSFMPIYYEERIVRDIEDVANKIVELFRIRNMPFFFQGIIENGKINVIEVSGRYGSYASFYITKHILGYDYIGFIVNAFLGQQNNISVSRIHKHYAMYYLYMHPGVFDSICGIDELIEMGYNIRLFPLKNQGDTISDYLNGANRIGIILVEGCKNDMSCFLSDMIRCIRIKNVEGQNLFYKELYM